MTRMVPLLRRYARTVLLAWLAVAGYELWLARSFPVRFVDQSGILQDVALNRPIAEIDLHGLTIAQAVEKVQSASGAKIVFSQSEAMARGGWKVNWPVIRGLSALQILRNLVARQPWGVVPIVVFPESVRLNADFQSRWDGETLFIEPLPQDEPLVLRIYDVRDLIEHARKVADEMDGTTRDSNRSLPNSADSEWQLIGLGFIESQGLPSVVAGRMAIRATPTNHKRNAALLAAMRVAFDESPR